VRQFGKDAFERLVAEALPLSRYFLERLAADVDLSSAEGRAALVHSAKPLVAQLQNTTFRVQILHDLAERAHLTVAEVESLCGLAPTAKAPARAAPAAAPRHAATASPVWRK